MFLDLLTARLRRLLDRQPRKRPTVRRRLEIERLEGRELLSTTPLLLDFGTSTSPVEAGYTRATNAASNPTPRPDADVMMPPALRSCGSSCS